MTLGPIREFIAPYLLWIKLGLAAAAVAGVVGLWLYHGHLVNKTRAAGYTAGYNARIADEAAAAKAAQAEADRRNHEAANATQSLHKTIATETPKIEASTHEAIERVKIVYRDHPVRADCVRPVGVRVDLDKARAAANAAAAGH